MSKRKKVQPCVYCGQNKLSTDDHVIPRCLFAGILPKDIVLVPVCEACNREKSKDDDFLRDWLVFDQRTSHHSIARQIFSGKFTRALKKGHSQLAKQAIKQATFQEVLSSGGIYLGHAFAMNLDEKRLLAIFTRIVRGLYYKIHRKRIPDSYIFDYRVIDPSQFNIVWEELKRRNLNHVRKIGDVFSMVMIRATEDEFVTMWWLVFYDGICIEVTTESSSMRWTSEIQKTDTSSPKLLP